MVKNRNSQNVRWPGRGPDPEFLSVPVKHPALEEMFQPLESVSIHQSNWNRQPDSVGLTDLTNRLK
jgi:hypothetical protein